MDRSIYMDSKNLCSQSCFVSPACKPSEMPHGCCEQIINKEVKQRDILYFGMGTDNLLITITTPLASISQISVNNTQYCLSATTGN